MVSIAIRLTNPISPKRIKNAIVKAGAEYTDLVQAGKDYAG